MADKTEPVGRMTFEQFGTVGLWVIIDGKYMDIIHYSDIEAMPDLQQKTKDAIDGIYQDAIRARAEEGE